MALRRLYNLTTASGNPSYLTNILPGGKSTQTAGVASVPFISGPRIEEYSMEVMDISVLGPAAQTVVSPAPTGALLCLDPTTGTIGGQTYRLNTIPSRRIAGGQYGIVYAPGVASEATVFTGAGGTQSTGTKALIIADGPCQALVATGNTNTTAVSAGMALASDNAGNLCYAGAAPNSGAVLATALGGMAASTSAPALMNVYVGGY